MDPQLVQAIKDIKGGVFVIFLLVVFMVVIQFLTIILKIVVYISITKQLNATWALLSLSKEYTKIADRQQKKAAKVLHKVAVAAEKRKYKFATVTADESGIIVEWDWAAQDMFHYTREEAIGKPVTILTPPEFVQAHEDGFWEAVKSRKLPEPGRTIEGVAMNKKGIRLAVTIRLSGWDAGGKLYYRAIIEENPPAPNVENGA